MRYRRTVIGLVLVSAIAIGCGAAARLVAQRQFRAELAKARQEVAAGLHTTAGLRLIRLAKQRPDEAEVTFLLGRCEAARGKSEAALELWAGIPADSPWGPSAALDFAHAAIPLGRIAGVERVLTSAMRRPSAQLHAMRRLMVILLGQQGRVNEIRRLIESQWQDTTILAADDVVERIAMLREHIGIDVEPFPLKWSLSRLQVESTSIPDEDERALALARAHLSTRAGDFELAKTELLTCLDRWRDDPMVWKSWLEWAVAAGRIEPAREALEHMPARLLDQARILELRVWFARQRRDTAAERRFLEQLIAIEPGKPSSLVRLAEIFQQTGETEASAALRRRKAACDAAFDRYNQLYKENQLSEHLAEMAALAERLGRWFEAGAFWEIVRVQEPSNAGAGPALARLRSTTGTTHSAETSGSLAQVLATEVGPGSTLLPGRSDLKGAGRGRIPHFQGRAQAAGLAGFFLDNGLSSIHQLPEASCGGIGLIDFDGDGFLDVYCVQGGHFPPGARTSYDGDQLFRNRGDGTFDDVTARSKISSFARGYGHGVAAGDYDNDGHPDLFVTRWRSYALYHNRGDGTFEDVTKKAGLGGDRDWPTSSAFADLDNDGDLDLYVCHYGAWDADNPRSCKDPIFNLNATCDPRVIEALPDHVFRNDSGKFVDVTAEAGIIDRDGRGLGVVATDLDDDGLIDLFVANDSTANYLFLNRGGFRFEEVGHTAGVAANAEGGYQAGMGIACGDLDGDGRPDLAVTNFYGESTTFFHNLGQGLFADHTSAIGLAAPSRCVLGFGAAFLDADNDGRLDLLTANGHVSDLRPYFPYAMPAQLYLGGETGSLTEVTARAGPPFQQLYVARGLAVGDLDNDGRVDALMVAQNDPLAYFHNRTEPAGRHFVTFGLEGKKSNRDGVGAWVAIEAGGRKQVAWRFGGGSFQSAGDPRLHFGLGSSDRIESVEVHWPSGQVDRYREIAVDQGYRLEEGGAALRLLTGFGP